MGDVVAAIDCGTTSVKAAIIDRSGRTRGEGARPCPCTPTPEGGTIIDPDTLLSAAAGALRDARESAGPASEPAALAVTNQRATVLAVDARDRPVGPAISWQDMRGAPAIDILRRRLSDERFYELTGLPLNPVFTLGKLLWMKQEAPDMFGHARRFALIHDYILRQWGADEWVTDYSNASLTGLMDIQQRNWCAEIFEAAELPEDRMPRLVPSGTPVGRLSGDAARATGLRPGLPLIAGGGDQQCAGLGMGIVRPGIAGVTLGTAAAPLCATEHPLPDPARRISCCAHAAPDTWELEGLQSCAGAGLDWMRRTMGIEKSAFDALRQDISESSADGLLFMPYLYGASAPFWNPEARGAFIGLRSEHTRIDLLRAVLESVAFETRQILEVFEALGAPINEVRLTGGGARCPAWKQIYADVLGRPIALPSAPQATLLGAAMLAATGASLVKSNEQAAADMVSIEEVCEPHPERQEIMECKYETFHTWAHRLAAQEGEKSS